MSPRLNRMWLMPFLLLASQAWALGLGDIRLSSALNEPLRAEIELLAATPEELTNLSIQMASAETYRRYNLDRPLFLTRLQFNVIRSGRVDGNVIRITSAEPVTEPFITFLVEASWTRGRLLREYTLLLDPPTFAPPPVTQSREAVTAPSRATPSDSGQIQRPPPQQQSRPPQPATPVEAPVQAPVQRPAQPPARQEPPPSVDFDSTPGGDLVIQRGETLWGIASRTRPDSRLSMNQTMLAIYEANPQAFNGNINRMRAGATLRIPSADDVFRISRGDALVEVQRQNAQWGGQAGVAPTIAPSVRPSVAPTVTPQPSLTLVPPDDDVALTDGSVDTADASGADDVADDIFVDPVDQRIREIESIVNDQNALLRIPSNELAALRAELAELRGEEPPVAVPVDDDVSVDDTAADDADIFADDDAVDTATPDIGAVPQVVSRPPQQDSIVDKILGYASNKWVIIGGGVALSLLILGAFLRRAATRDDEDITGVWDALDADEVDSDSIASTERLRALARDDDESFVVVEGERAPRSGRSRATDDASDDLTADTMETRIRAKPAAVAPAADPLDDTGTNKSLEDTFSSETAINLDQSDPVAEADFHMAYGLYDQAADLINGALAADPNRQDLLAKLCEIYFVWGNRDAFVDAAARLKAQAAGEDNADWDKIIIMGQQIAGDHEMFSGVSAEGVTKAVDLSFEGGMDDAGALDMDFAGGPDGAVSEVIDLGSDFGDDGGDDTGQVLISPDRGTGIDFSFDEEPDLDLSITREMPEKTVESPTLESAANEDTVETPTIEQQFEMDATGELPAMSEPDYPQSQQGDSTAEIDLDDLGLDLEGLDETSIAIDDDQLGDLDDTAESQTLQIDESLAATGKNPAIDIDDSLIATGRNLAIDDSDDDNDDIFDASDFEETLDVDEALAATSDMPSLDEGTRSSRALSDDEMTHLASLDDNDEDTDIGIDTSLLDATGQTQVLTDDMAVETASDIESDLSDDDATMLTPGYGAEDTVALSSDAETMLASMDDDDDEFDFAKTEALPKDVFSSDMSSDETGRMPGLAGSTDLDLDLDDLTAALKVSEVGDTVNQIRDDATVEQPRIRPGGQESSEFADTQALAPEDLSGDLHEARTMTEVGTKLDLARAYVDMGDPGGARSILEEVLDEGDEGQRQQAQKLLDSLPA